MHYIKPLGWTLPVVLELDDFTIGMCLCACACMHMCVFTVYVHVCVCSVNKSIHLYPMRFLLQFSFTVHLNITKILYQILQQQNLVIIVTAW